MLCHETKFSLTRSVPNMLLFFIAAEMSLSFSMLQSCGYYGNLCRWCWWEGRRRSLCGTLAGKQNLQRNSTRRVLVLFDVLKMSSRMASLGLMASRTLSSKRAVLWWHLGTLGRCCSCDSFTSKLPMRSTGLLHQVVCEVAHSMFPLLIHSVRMPMRSSRALTHFDSTCPS